MRPVRVSLREGAVQRLGKIAPVVDRVVRPSSSRIATRLLSTPRQSHRRRKVGCLLDPKRTSGAIAMGLPKSTYFCSPSFFRQKKPKCPAWLDNPPTWLREPGERFSSAAAGPPRAIASTEIASHSEHFARITINILLVRGAVMVALTIGGIIEKEVRGSTAQSNNL